MSNTAVSYDIIMLPYASDLCPDGLVVLKPSNSQRNEEILQGYLKVYLKMIQEGKPFATMPDLINVEYEALMIMSQLNPDTYPDRSNLEKLYSQIHQAFLHRFPWHSEEMHGLLLLGASFPHAVRGVALKQKNTKHCKCEKCEVIREFHRELTKVKKQ